MPDSENPHSSDNVIRISRTEALGEHVDDLLKRQMSLRGEAGITREHGRRWYYQNWFVFMVAGALAAVAAWALLEPLFDDMLYVRGTIEAVDASAAMPSRVNVGDQTVVVRTPAYGWLQIRGEQIWLSDRALDWSGGRKRLLDPETLKVGEDVGVYVEYLPMYGEDLAVAYYLERAPAGKAPAKAGLSLARLNARSHAAAMFLFPLVAGFIGLAIGAVDGLICRLLRRALLGGVVGLLVGLIGGFVCSIVANLVYAPLSGLAVRLSEAGSLSTLGFVLQMIGRALAWSLAGMAMGLGQGIALRSKRVLLYGFLGGIVGGLLGGLLFDPIDLLLLGQHKPSAHWSRLIGLAVIGAGVGAMIGVVELLARDAWLRMTEGPLTGKEFLVFKDLMRIGSSPRSDIYLFNDPQVQADHATLRAAGDECEIASVGAAPLLLNRRSVRSARLRHGDQITLGRTSFVFEKRQG